jgi:hypothetical protein
MMCFTAALLACWIFVNSRTIFLSELRLDQI